MVHLFDGRIVEDERGARQRDDERKLTESGFGTTA
jgi:hypothetical protein